jgi:hypothetical protein
MRISEAISMMKRVQDILGDVQICILAEEGNYFAFSFPKSVAAIGMPTQDEMSEIPVCAFTMNDLPAENGTITPRFSVLPQ